MKTVIAKGIKTTGKSKLIFCLTLLIMLPLSAASQSAPLKHSDFQLFWQEFREASLADDYATLASLTKFPLQVKGLSDEPLAANYKANEFKKIFPQLLTQVVYQYQDGKLTETTLKEVIRKKEKIAASPKETEIRVDQIKFKLIDGKWFLTRAYIGQ
ncbi:MAG TPA: hypothetical protein VN030_13940 [Cellvibrio sp.]|nr:hypothetical protein [Cellvibrio sp.]